MFKDDSYYVLTKKEEPEQFSSIIIQGVWLTTYDKIEQRYYIREATLAEVALKARPPVDKATALAKIKEIRAKKSNAYYR
jgi:hypothetical protein